MRYLIFLLSLFALSCAKAEDPINVKSSRSIEALSVDLQDAHNQIIHRINLIDMYTKILAWQNDQWDSGCDGFDKSGLYFFASQMLIAAQEIETLEAEYEGYVSGQLAQVYGWYKPYIDSRVSYLVYFSAGYISVLNEPETQCGTDEPRLDGRVQMVRNQLGLKTYHERLLRFF